MYVYLGIRSELFGLCVGFLEMTRSKRVRSSRVHEQFPEDREGTYHQPQRAQDGVGLQVPI
jgi:hypothetical protein